MANFVCLQMILPNLTTNTIYEVKVRAASISTINSRQIILGSYSEPKKVCKTHPLSNSTIKCIYSHSVLSLCILKSNYNKYSTHLLTDSDATQLRENPATAPASTDRLQSGNGDRDNTQLLWIGIDSYVSAIVAVSLIITF